MAKIKNETTGMEPETTSRSAQIATLIPIVGTSNEAIWAAMEVLHPSTIPADDERRNPKHKKFKKDLPPFDKEERARLSRDINSTRKQVLDQDAETRGVVELVGGNDAGIQSPDDIELTNRHRFPSGEPAMNYIYGETRFKHLSDAPDSKYKKEKRIIRTRDEHGVTVEKATMAEVWKSGSWRVGDPMIPLHDGDGYVATRDKDGNMIADLDLKKQINQSGIPEAFLSVWGGEYGAGKSRLAVMIGKGVTQAIREPVLYINGEATPEDMRSWLGHDVDPDLFKLVNADMLPIQRIMDFAKVLRPRLIVIDSIQTIAEMNKGTRAVNSTMAILKMMKSSPEYGKPHIILISQLNAQGKLKGGTAVPHLADAVAHVRKMEGKKGMFIFEIPRKNRGGETPRGATFRHTADSVECVSTELIKAPIYKLLQPSNNDVIQRGLVDPTPPPAADNTAGSDDTSTDDTTSVESTELAVATT